MKAIALLCILLVGCAEPETTCYSIDADGGVVFNDCTEEEISAYLREHGIEQEEVYPAPTP